MVYMHRTGGNPKIKQSKHALEVAVMRRDLPGVLYDEDVGSPLVVQTPVTKGVYKMSRHPQIVALFILFLGICVTIGSWVALFMLLMSRLLQHFGILAEEEVCLRRYGESYRTFMEQVPRYFLVF
jgi:steroid 5-alpha reductase family enzyme